MFLVEAKKDSVEAREERQRKREREREREEEREFIESVCNERGGREKDYARL